MSEKIMISCKIAAELSSARLERRLTPKEFLKLWIHLAMCKTCLYYHKQIKALQKLFVCYTQAVIDSPPPKNASLPPQARKRIISSLAKNQ